VDALIAGGRKKRIYRMDAMQSDWLSAFEWLYGEMLTIVLPELREILAELGDDRPPEDELRADLHNELFKRFDSIFECLVDPPDGAPDWITHCAQPIEIRNNFRDLVKLAAGQPVADRPKREHRKANRSTGRTRRRPFEGDARQP
jgi:hypothetical protein